MASRDSLRPNVLFILSDDQGPWAMGCAGNPEIRTPNLDRLAATGMRFENFFCVSPVCSPARASLMTGKIPSQHGVHDWIREGNYGEHTVEYLKGQRAYTDVLAAQGYVCGFSGKWHLGDSARPQKSFTHWFVHEKGGGPYYNAPMIRNGELVNEPGYVTDVITDDACQFIMNQAGAAEPFYLSVHYTAPHSPWIDNHPPEIVASYDDCPFESCPEEPAHPWTGPGIGIPQARENRRESLKGYFAAVTAMDLNIGRLLDTLEAQGLRENTLVFFTSDNGFNCGHHGIWGKGNGTFPLNMYDTSVKVPAIISQPGRVPQGGVNDDLLSGYDVMPTLLDFLGYGDQYDASHLPGHSFASLLNGHNLGDDQERKVIVFDEYGPVRMLRTKGWKYVHRYPYGPHELYDLKNDPDERHNLIDECRCASILATMRADLDSWFQQYVDPAVDGVRQPVTGKGQLRAIGPDRGDTPHFAGF